MAKSYLLYFIMISLYMPTLLSANCADHAVSLQVLGSGGPELDDQRASSSYLIWADNKAIAMIDVGGGASLNYEKSMAKLEDLEVVAFSHLHVDHSADFPVFIKAAYFSSRDRPLIIFGPDGNDLMPSTTTFMADLFGSEGGFRYLKDYLLPNDNQHFWLKTQTVTMDKNNIQSFQITPSLSLSTIAVHHGPIPALAWRVDIDDCAITFSGDMNNDFHSLTKLAQNTDILVAHNAITGIATGGARQLHMPPSEIGLIAQRARVKQLVISHRMNRTLGKEEATTQDIRQAYSGKITFANDLDIIQP